MTKQVVKIFTADQIKDWALETVINEFLKENPDHKIILTDYCLIEPMSMPVNSAHDWEERTLIVFEVSDSTSTGGRKKSKPKPKPSGKKPRREPREPTDWSIPMPSGQKPYEIYKGSWTEPQRIRQ